MWSPRSKHRKVIRVAFTRRPRAKAAKLSRLFGPEPGIRGVHRRFNLKKLRSVRRGADRILYRDLNQGWVTGTNYYRNRIYVVVPAGSKKVKRKLKTKFGRAIAVRHYPKGVVIEPASSSLES